MICNNFQKKHLLNLLKGFNLGSIPLDLFCHRYFKNNHCLGSNDRKIIRHISYEIIKNLYFIDEKTKKEKTWQDRVQTYLSINLKEEIANEKELCPEKIVSLPSWLFEKIKIYFGLKKAIELGYIMLKKAPIFIRVNTLKTTRDNLYNALNDHLDLQICQNSNSALRVLKPAQFKSLKEYLEGYFEVQDLSSQMATEYLELSGNERILDFCAGSGGKSLHLAAQLKNKGQINLFDVRKNALINAKARLKKAGAFNTKIYFNKNDLKQLKHKMDIVLLDVPCSGSGTFRRNPEQKYRLTQKDLAQLIQQQRSIVKESLSYLKPNARIIYITCSILADENEEQIAYFYEHFNLATIGNSRQILPKENEGDGFFIAQMKFNS